MREGDGVRRATPDDAAAIAGLIRDCYGSSHPVKTYVDPEALRTEMLRGDAVYVVAEEKERLVAQAALVRVGSAGLYECTRAIVAVEHRDRGHFGALASRLIERVAPEIGARYVMARAVTNHPFAQRFARSSGGVASGVLLAMIPATLTVAGFGDAGAPVTTIVHLHRIAEDLRPRRLALDGHDLERVRRIFARLSVPILTAKPGDSPSHLGVRAITYDRSFGVAHLKIGADPARPLDGGVVEEAAREARLVWADVPLEHPSAATAIEQLREAGLGFSGYIPLAGQDGEDVLRLQLVVDPEVRSSLEVVALDENRWLVGDVLAEARRVPVLA